MDTSIRGERKKGDGASALDRLLEFPLVRRAGSGDAARQDLAALRDVALQQTHVLVVDEGNLLVAELAELPAAEEELLAPGLARALRLSSALPHARPPS